MAKILIVDDNPTNLQLYSDLMDLTDHSAVTLDRAECVLETARAELPALILLDLTMPGMTGFAVAEQLKRDGATAHIPLVALTAMDREDLTDRLRQSGFSGLIPKPCGVNTVLQAVEWALTAPPGEFRRF